MPDDGTDKTIARRDRILKFMPSVKRRKEALRIFDMLDKSEPVVTKSAPEQSEK